MTYVGVPFAASAPLSIHFNLDIFGMRFSHRLVLCAAVPALLFLAGLGASIWGLVATQRQFDDYIGTEQARAANFNEMYAQGLQMGQALRNMVLDPANPKARDNLDNSRLGYDKAFAELSASVAGTPLAADVDALVPLRKAQGEAQDKVIALIVSDPPAAIKLLNSIETPAWRALRAALLKQLEIARKASDDTHLVVNANASRATLLGLVLAVLAAVVSAALCLFVQRTVQRELGGDPATVRAAMLKIARGDLSEAMAEPSGVDNLMSSLAQMQRSLRLLVGQVRSSTDSISTASEEIATGNQDLSDRTEQTASNLQQAASSMEQLSGTVKESAASARQADQLASTAAQVAVRGGEVVAQVVTTMQQITTSSKRIGDIIGVIDGIAFQTNILALNAAVEAARAGEQGRGFAVVASEVRSLAGRSAEAAKEIKTLIGASVDHVDAGSTLVADAGRTMDEIVGSVKRVSDIVAMITASASEQAEGIQRVSGAVTQLDQMTQQNSALVEQSAAAAASLKDQAHRMAEVVGTFKLG
jgi:methyl-accepting chemotaxis protein